MQNPLLVTKLHIPPPRPDLVRRSRLTQALDESNAEIAERLFITLGTVKRHINHIYSKLAVRTSTQAIVRAAELGLVD